MIRHSAVDDAVQPLAMNVAYSGLQSPARHAAQHSAQVSVAGQDAAPPQLSCETFLSSLSFVMASIVVLAELTRVVRFGRRKTSGAAS